MAFDFQKVTKDLMKSLGVNKTKSVIGLDVGSSFIKVVQLRKDQDRAVLETYGEVALGPYAGLDVGRATNLPMDKLVQAVSDLFNEANVTTNVAGLALPLGSTLLSLIEMPEMDEDALAKAIPIEARKYIPVPITEVALDSWIIPRKKGESPVDEKGVRKNVEVLVVAIHNEVIEKYNDLMRKTNLVNTSLEIEVFSAVRSTFNHDMSPLMFLDVGAGTSKIAMVEQGIIRSSHIINRGSQDISIALSRALNVSLLKAEKLKVEVGLTGQGENKKVSDVVDSTLNYILSEANRVLLNYQMKYNRTITKVVLTGGGVLLKGFVEAASKKLSSEVVYGDAFSKVETPAFLEPVLKEAGPEFAVALGLALRRLQEK